jgi:hypothetical protein
MTIQIIRQNSMMARKVKEYFPIFIVLDAGLRMLLFVQMALLESSVAVTKHPKTFIHLSLNH